MEFLDEMIADIILCEISDMAAARELTPNRTQLRSQTHQTDMARYKSNAAQLQQDMSSTDPLIRRKAQLQKALAMVIKQIQQRQQRQQQQQSVDSIAGGLTGA